MIPLSVDHSPKYIGIYRIHSRPHGDKCPVGARRLQIEVDVVLIFHFAITVIKRATPFDSGESHAILGQRTLHV